MKMPPFEMGLDERVDHNWFCYGICSGSVVNEQMKLERAHVHSAPRYKVHRLAIKPSGQKQALAGSIDEERKI